MTLSSDDSGSLHVQVKCILKRLVLFLFTAIDPWGEETWGEENGCRQFCSNSAPNVDEDFFAQMSPPLNFPPMQHGRRKQWQIIHSPLLLFAVERALLSQLEHCFGWLLCRLWQFALSGYHLKHG